MSAALVIRRALGTPRDVERVARALAGAGEPVGDALGAALRDDRWGLVLLAERRGDVAGFAVIRFVAPVGAAAGGAPHRAWLDALHADDAEVRAALDAAARAEAEARELPWRSAEDRVATHETPALQADVRSVERIAVGDATLEFCPDGAAPPMVTRWSGALAFRARWATDRARGGWSVEGCVGSVDDEGDALRFDAATRALREVYLARPGRVSGDGEVLARVRSLSPRAGSLRLAAGVDAFAMPSTSSALFDVSLDVIAALRDGALEGELTAVAVTDALALLFCDGAYAGWRVVDPVAHVRPMGWPDVQEGAGASRRDALTALVHDWMVIDASPRVRPDEAVDAEEIEHMVALRARARALAETPGSPDDPTPAVARDIGAHVHWSWGFFRVPE